jgi:hypothetical protein
MKPDKVNPGTMLEPYTYLKIHHIRTKSSFRF